MNHCVVLFLCLTAQHCVSSSVFSKHGKHAEEELLDKSSVSVLQDEVKKGETETPRFTATSIELKDSSSSGESESSEVIKKNAVSSESSSSSERSSSESSEDDHQRKKIVKRSLDSKSESINLIGKTNNNLEKNSTSVLESSNTTVTEYSSDETPKESTTPNTESTTQFEAEARTVSKSDATMETSEAETKETENQTTTDSQGETTTEEQIDTTETEQNAITNEPEGGSDLQPEVVPETTVNPNPDPEPMTESEPGTSSQVNPEIPDVNPEKSSEVTNSTTESESTTTTETTPEITQSSSEDGEDELPYYSPSSTPSTEVASTTPEDNRPKTMMEKAMDRVNKLSDQIRLVLTTYKKVGVVVVPGQSFFPEPMPMQDFRKSFSIGTMDFKATRVYGLSNFTVEHINTDVDRMQVYILLHMKKLVILGNYTLRTFFNRAAGPFNVTLLDVDSEGVAEIETAPEGYMEAADSQMDMFTKDMRVDFKNLGFMGSMFQGMVSTVGDALFNSIKPQILERVNLVIRTDVNKKLREFSTKFVNKVNPVDLAFSEGRKYCRTQGYDPYHINDHTFLLGGLVYVNITDFWVEGLSRFHRVGNLSLSMDAGVIEIAVHVLTGKLTGQCHWTGQTFGIVKYGKTNFTVDHLQVRAMVHQSLDVRKKPQLKDLDLELGWVKVTMNSPMTLNMMIEGIINAFPRLIRHIIVDTLEQPLKEKIQEILDKINVEAIVDENLPRLDNFGL